MTIPDLSETLSKKIKIISIIKDALIVSDKYPGAEKIISYDELRHDITHLIFSSPNVKDNRSI